MQISPEAQNRISRFVRPERIVLATDLNDYIHLLPHAIAQAQHYNAHLTIVHCLLSVDIAPLEQGRYLIPAEDVRAAHRAEKMLAEMVVQVRSCGLRCDQIITHCYPPADSLTRAVSKADASRIIVATHGRGKLGQFVLGSVTNDLLGTLALPIFAVGPHAHECDSRCTPAKILHPVSFAEDFREGVAFAQQLAEVHRAELILLHVLDLEAGGKAPPERAVEWAKHALLAAAHDRPAAGLPVSARVGYGDVCREILGACRDVRPDWIVIGADRQPHGMLAAAGAAYKVMCRAGVPVLTLPRRQAPAATNRSISTV